MSFDMNKIIRENYPASRLPQDLRPSADPAVRVTVIIEQEERRPDKILMLEEIFAARIPPFRSKEEIDATLRQQRDEWNR
jgi:hypothetical protein